MNFETKTSALSFFKKMLNNYHVGAKLNNEDYLQVIELLHHHSTLCDRVDEITAIVILPDCYGGRCFHAVMINDELTPFSYINTIKKPQNVQYVYDAFRKTIDYIVLNRKNEYAITNCVNMTSLTHHHLVKLIDLINNFIKINNLDINQISYKNALYGDNIENEDIRKNWITYYLQNSTYSIS